MAIPKILVTGCNGQLGKEIQSLAQSYPQLQFIFLSKETLPIHQTGLVNDCFTSIQPDYCINCAAYTAVDRAETEREQAFLINGTATGVLATACKRFETKFIHISTDYVFNGLASQPYKEADKVDPVNLYGASKLEGERRAFAENEQSVVIRTSWVYSEYGNNFVKTMIRLMKERNNIKVVNDQHGAPTYAADLAQVIVSIIREEKWHPGVYHYSNEANITWYEFAAAIKQNIKSPCEVHPIPTAEFPTPAKRPSYSVFNKDKIREVYAIRIPDWKDSLRACMTRILP